MSHTKHHAKAARCGSLYMLQAVCVAVIAATLFVVVMVGSASAWFTDTQTVQVEEIRASASFPPKKTEDTLIMPDDAVPAVVDDPEPAEEPADAPVPTEQPTPPPSDEPAVTPDPTVEPTETPAAEEETTPTPTPAPDTDPAAEQTEIPETVTTEEPTTADPVAYTAGPHTRVPHRAPQNTAEIQLYRGSGEDAKPFSLSNLLPGDSAAKDYTVTVSHSGRVTLHFGTVITSDPGRLARTLHITVNCDRGTLYEGTLADLPGSLPIDLQEGESTARYRIDITLPTSAGNEYQNKTLTADLKWWVQEYPGTSANTGTSQGGTLTLPPQTGDEFPLGLLLVVIIGAAAALIALTFLQQKGNKHER